MSADDLSYYESMSNDIKLLLVDLFKKLEPGTWNQYLVLAFEGLDELTLVEVTDWTSKIKSDWTGRNNCLHVYYAPISGEPVTIIIQDDGLN